MEITQIEKALVVYKKSNFALYTNSPDAYLCQFMQGESIDVQRMKESHDRQERALETVLRDLDRTGIRYDAIYRADLETRNDLDDKDLLITIGGDGTVIDTSHFDRKVPILGVNSDPETSIGYFCCCDAEGFAQVIHDIRSATKTTLYRIDITLDGKLLPQPALNDILIAHDSPGAQTRYRLNDGDNTHRGSGLLACTAAGSTARMWNENGSIMPLDSTQMQYVELGVRNRMHRFADGLRICSRTRQGKIFIDGPHVVYDFCLGQDISLRCGTPLIVYGDLEKKREETVRRLMQYA